MVTFLKELNFWTFDSDVNIKETDFGAFSYHDKKVENVYDEGKKFYAQKREMVYTPQNKKGNRLKEMIKFLEEQLREFSCLYCQWFDESTITIMLSSGLFIYAEIDIGTGDVDKIIFDKYLVGKLSDRLSDAVITKNYIICTYNDTQVTLVNFHKTKKSIFDKISKLDPKVSTFDLQGPAGRRLEKKVQINRTEDLILIWWKYTMNEVYPWSPTIREHDRANVHFYRLSGTKLDLLSYLQTEFDPLCITFSTSHDHVVHSVEQKVSRKGEVTVEWRTYEIARKDKLQRIAVVSIPLPTHTSCVKFSPNQEMLLLCCIDGSVTLHDYTKGSNHTMKAAFIPTMASWHGNGKVFAIGNERGQMQNFDISLSCIKSQILSEDYSTSSVLDLSCYFKTQPALSKMDWCKRSEKSSYFNRFNRGDAFFLLLFEKGPLAIVKIIEGENITGDGLVRKYLSVGQADNAISLLNALNWNIEPEICMHSLNLIVNHVFKLPLNFERENQIQNALGTFHLPVKPLNPLVIDKYREEVRDLTRRFFHHLLRYRLFETAFRLAIDLNDHDLFMDIHYYATVLKDDELAKASHEKAEEIVNEANSDSHSTCSRSSCSICADTPSDKEESLSGYSEAEEALKKAVSKCQQKSASSQALSQPPNIPILYPQTFTGSTISASSSNISENPASYSMSHFDPSVFLPQVPYVRNQTYPNLMPNHGAFAKSCDNLLSPFGSLSLTPSVAQSSLNSMSLENMANSYQLSNFINQTFSNPMQPAQPMNEAQNQKLNQFINQNFPNSMQSVQPMNEAQNQKLSQFINQTFSNSMQPGQPMNEAQNQKLNQFINQTFPKSIDLVQPINETQNQKLNHFVNQSFSNSMQSNQSMNEAQNQKLSHFTNQTFSNLMQSAQSMNEAQNQQLSQFINQNFSNPVQPVLPSNEAPNEKLNHFINQTFPNPAQPVQLMNETQNQKLSHYISQTFPNLIQSVQPMSEAQNEKLSHFINQTFPGPMQPVQSINQSQNEIVVESKVNDTISSVESDDSVLTIKPAPAWVDNTMMSTSFNEPIIEEPIQVHPKPLEYDYAKNESGLPTTPFSNNVQATRKYRVDYDLDYVPFSNNYENMDSLNSIINNVKNDLDNASKNYGNIRQYGRVAPMYCEEYKIPSNLPQIPVMGSRVAEKYSSLPIFPSGNGGPMGNEKPKVKFSDTVTHILVPNLNQSYDPVNKGMNSSAYPIDPRKELNDSLPPYLGNENFLKDFQHISKEECDKSKQQLKTDDAPAKIKVVHFGLL